MDTLTSRLFGEAQVRLRQHRPLLQMQLSSISSVAAIAAADASGTGLMN